MTRPHDREVAAYFDDLAAHSADPEAARLWRDTARIMRRESRHYWHWLRWVSHPITYCGILGAMWAWWLLGDALGGSPIDAVVLIFRCVYTSAMVVAIKSMWITRRRAKRYHVEMRAEIAERAERMRGEQ